MTTPKERTMPMLQLANRANERHAKVLRASAEMLRYAKEAGEALLEAKARCPHGTFRSWLADHFEASDSTAMIYMRIARCWADVEAAGLEEEGLVKVRQFLAKPGTKLSTGKNRGAGSGHGYMVVALQKSDTASLKRMADELATKLSTDRAAVILLAVQAMYAARGGK